MKMVLLAIVVFVIGVGFLYQQDGGHLFGPDGIVPAPQPMLVSGFGGKSSTHTLGGVELSTDYVLTNETGKQLDKVALTFTFCDAAGNKVPVEKFWSSWAPGEEKSFNEPTRCASLVIKGTAQVGATPVRIDEMLSAK